MNYEFDVFDTWCIEDGKLKLPLAGSEHTLVPDREDTGAYMLAIASAFGTELFPLMEQASERGIDINDRVNLSRYFNELGEPGWARYIGREISDEEYRELVRIIVGG